MNLTDDERIRCEECLKKFNEIKFFCIQSIEYLVEQQREIDECIYDLKTTKHHAEEINKKISELNSISCLKFCFLFSKETIVESNFNEQNQLLILPFPNQIIDMKNNLSMLMNFEKDLQLEKILLSIKKNISFEYLTKEDFERILHEEYTMLFELAKKLTKCVQILHDTIEFLGRDIKLTLDHMQLAQPRMKQLLQTKVPIAFAEVEKNF